MPAPATAAAPWTLAGAVATARAGSAAARLDLAAPAAGLVVTAAGRADHLLGVDLRAPGAAPADHWIRGADLTAVYEPDDARRLRATAMWRLRPDAAAWELVVSAQTALLHADAALAVVSDLAGDTAAWAAPATAARAVRWTPARPGVLPPEAAFVLVHRGDSSAVVAVHPQDPRRIEVGRADGRIHICCGIFPAALEKGVILRSRVLAAIGPATDAEAWAAETCTAFAASPPFLDT